MTVIMRSVVQKAMEFEEQIPIGVLYQENKDSFHQKNAVLKAGLPLLDRNTNTNYVSQLIQSYI